VQEGYVAAEAIYGDVLELSAPTSARRGAAQHEYRALIEVGSVNYALKTEGEQEAILAGYRDFLNGLTFPLQILVQVRPLDLAPYVVQIRAARDAFVEFEGSGDAVQGQRTVWARLAEDQAQYVLDLAAQKTLLERRFYLVVPDDGQAAIESGMGGRHGTSKSGPAIPLLSLSSWPLPGRAGRRRAASRAGDAAAGGRRVGSGLSSGSCARHRHPTCASARCACWRWDADNGA
jgi:hypothetical protein